MRLRQSIYAALLSLLPALAAAGEPAATTIRLEPYVGDLLMVHATVNGQPGTFLFDTGGGISIITPAFAQKAGCKPWGQITAFRLTGERFDAPHCDGLSFEMGGNTFKPVAVGVFDIMKFIGANAPVIDGSLGLDQFADRIVTILPGEAIVVETPKSLAARIAKARELPVRLVRDAEGVSLTVNGAVQTPVGLAWMELDTGNTGTLYLGNHIAPLVGVKPGAPAGAIASVTLANGIVVSGPTQTRNLIMDGNIGAAFLNHWAMTLDLKHGRAWLAPYTPEKKPGN